MVWAIEIPVKFVNNDKSPGLKRGGVLNIVRRKIELKCPSENIPTELVVDLDNLDIGASIKISSIKLPENVSPTIQGRDFVVATVAAPTIIKEPEKPAEEATEEGAEGAEGAEGVETSIKLSRKWGYLKKNVDENQAKIIVCNNNFHGRTTTVISFSTDPGSKDYFGPHTPGFIHNPHGDANALEDKLKKDKNIVAFLVEPIQGEAGVNVPDSDYLKNVRHLCSKYNVLMIADEIQTGLGRTGSLLASCGNCNCNSSCEQQSTYVRPDILILAKALSGGTYPISAVLCDSYIMEVIQPGQHGSTFGGNPFAASIAKKALEIIIEENLSQNARALGEIFRDEMNKYISNSNIVSLVRGKGLLNAIVINDSPDSKTAWNICLKLRDNGLLAKPTHGNVIRFAPPLVMTEDQLYECIDIITSTLKEFEPK